jgi:hypothetical protein
MAENEQGQVTKRTRSTPDWKVIENLYLQGFLPAAISQKTGIAVSTIKVGLCKRGVTKLKQKPESLVNHLGMEGMSRNTRSTLAKIVEETAEKLKNPPKSLEKLALHADITLKTIKGASTLHGWGEGAAIALVIPGVLTGDDQGEPAIDVESSAEPDPEG